MVAKNFSVWLKPSWSGSVRWKPSLPNLEVWPFIPFIFPTSMRFPGQEIFKYLGDIRNQIWCGVQTERTTSKSCKDNVNSTAKLWMYENYICEQDIMGIHHLLLPQSHLHITSKQWLPGTSNDGLVFRNVPTTPSYTERERERKKGGRDFN